MLFDFERGQGDGEFVGEEGDEVDEELDEAGGDKPERFHLALVLVSPLALLHLGSLLLDVGRDLVHGQLVHAFDQHHRQVLAAPDVHQAAHVHPFVTQKLHHRTSTLPRDRLPFRNG